MSRRKECPACGMKRSVKAFEKEGYAVHRCRLCKTLYIENPPSAEDLIRIYNHGSYYELAEESIRRIQREALRRCRIVKRWKRIGTFIEIGCARGWQLDAARAAGFETYGTELSQKNVSMCTERGHHVVHGGMEEAKEIKPQQGFDIVACLDVIEHVLGPRDFLGKAADLLADDGILIVSTPNYSGVVAKVLGAEDPFMIPPEHLNFFTLQGLRLMFGSAGLDVLYRTTFGALTIEERKRIPEKYLPTPLKRLGGIASAVAPLGVYCLNLLKVGLEMEVYLRKQRWRQTLLA